MEVQLITDANGDAILPLPDELFLNEGWLEGDEILFTVDGPLQIRMDNLSRLEISEKELQEKIVNLLARIDDASDFLNRVVITRNGIKIAILRKHMPSIAL